MPESQTISNSCIKGFKDNLGVNIESIESINSYKGNLSDELSTVDEVATTNQDDIFQNLNFEYYGIGK